MFNFIETILIKVFSLLPDADPSSMVITAVTSAFATLTPTFAKLDLVFPIYTLFQILLIVLAMEMTLFLFTLVFKVATFFKP
jgi:hypothetical protein